MQKIRADLEEVLAARNHSRPHEDFSENLDSRAMLAAWFGTLTKCIEQDVFCNVSRDDLSRAAFPAARYPLSPAAEKSVERLVRTLGAEMVALICLQELTRVSAYNTELKGVSAKKLAGDVEVIVATAF